MDLGISVPVALHEDCLAPSLGDSLFDRILKLAETDLAAAIRWRDRIKPEVFRLRRRHSRCCDELFDEAWRRCEALQVPCIDQFDPALRESLLEVRRLERKRDRAKAEFLDAERRLTDAEDALVRVPAKVLATPAIHGPDEPMTARMRNRMTAVRVSKDWVAVAWPYATPRIAAISWYRIKGDDAAAGASASADQGDEDLETPRGETN